MTFFSIVCNNLCEKSQQHLNVLVSLPQFNCHVRRIKRQCLAENIGNADKAEELIALINPIVPTEIISSVSASLEAYFLTICATSLIFFCTRISCAAKSPSLSRKRHSFSSSAVSGFSNIFKKETSTLEK